ncbi:hypothetical protein Q428_05400 [Fervidicella metallireducens AeB]|uniref:LD-carboxypeptidase N-terminal domain-containing protein n=1 Tax=Fervidicella metallireducens AeB TaxID=1403537 RepID=A0A017RX31_9CLOT|nr:hypothetical protein Q428_05400 [Fervidicella metallireducens AeB]
MIKPKSLKKGDKIAVVSLSSGILGEDFVKHQLDLGLKRIREFEPFEKYFDFPSMFIYFYYIFSGKIKNIS